MKKSLLLLSGFLSFIFFCFSQSDNLCAVKIGKSYYINCKHIIVCKGQDVFTITDTKGSTIKINFDIFSVSGKKIAVVKDGQLISGDKNSFIIKSTDKEFVFMEKAANRVICYVKKTFNKEQNRCELHVSADMYMPSGFYFQCTPDTTNVPLLNMMNGATFENSEAAITLN